MPDGTLVNRSSLTTSSVTSTGLGVVTWYLRLASHDDVTVASQGMDE